ncbi:MAG: trypsin-like peptidase domain-containing protein [Actinomycetota bacterium]|jgi:S1-C subfamily serine protease
MEFVESDDGPPFRRPPALDDRVWRHPSELEFAAPTGPRTVTHRTVWAVAIAAAIGASLLSTGLLIGLGAVRTGEQAAERTVTTVGAATPVTAVEQVVAIAERARPGIVQIRANRAGSGVSGSGVIFREDGHLLTNAHVVDSATAITAVLASGRELPARVVGADPDTDTAVLKIDGGPFATTELGTAASLKVGQLAVAMGSPLALAGGPSVTVGVVSALHRTVRTRGGTVTLHDMIQTDAPISPGSSGGALLDGSGRVIGITTAVAVSDVGPEGLGFATPIDVARTVADEIIATGRATHPWLGISGIDLDGATAHDLNLDGAARIVTVVDGGPAALAGIQEGDLVVGLGGRPVKSMGTLVVALRQHRPGDLVAVEVIRDGHKTVLNVVLIERTDAD